MLTASPASQASLRVLCLEDNPLIVFHLQSMIEDLGHHFVQAFESFADMRDHIDLPRIDCALIDIDLTDGRTGPDAAAWLHQRGVPTLFVTGQERLAGDYCDIVLGIVPKPVSPHTLQAGLDGIAAALRMRDDGRPADPLPG